MPNIGTFTQRMLYWCDSANLGYDQGNRWDIRVGGECDCSSLVIHCLHEAGFATGDASWTGNMRDNLACRGWRVMSASTSPQVGDILLNDAHHVAVCTKPGYMSFASIDERGRASGGRSGDQTGLETKTVKGFAYSRGWSCILRYGGTTSGSSKTSGTVSNVQAWLNNSYSSGLVVDGSYGPKTKKALVKALQRELVASGRVKMGIDGIMGPKTKAACPNLAKAAGYKPLVKILQAALICRGFKVEPFDGIFGSKTEAAVKAFQKYAKINQDGIAGPVTFYNLLK